MITDPWFYAVALPAVVVTGISKGGFGAGLGVLSVPLMALVIPAGDAAGIMLPVLLIMDAVGVWRYRRTWDRRNLEILIPAALLGIAVGFLTASVVEEGSVNLLTGAIAVAFTLDRWLRRPSAGRTVKRATVPDGVLWGSLTGFTSFTAHSGGPPFQVYTLPQRLPAALYVGTNVLLFAAVNAAKVPPYAILGRLDTANLATSAVLFPLAPVGILLGFWIQDRIPAEPFYRICYVLLFVVGLRLLWDGLGL